MVAYDSRWSSDPSQFLRPETLHALRTALEEQRSVGHDPTAALTDAIKAAAVEAHDRGIMPEALIIQLKAIADDIGLAAKERAGTGRTSIREWMVLTCLQAYFKNPE